MKLSLDPLAMPPSEFSEETSDAWWQQWMGEPDAARYQRVGRPVFRIEAGRVDDDVRIEGELSGAIDVECSRCLKRYRHALSDTFQLTLEPIRDRRAPDREAEESLAQYGLCLSDELEVGWYRGKEVQLDPLLAEVAAHAMPVQPLCREECAGLCPRCGIDRNTASCDCTDEKPDSPFAVLAALRNGSDGSN